MHDFDLMQCFYLTILDFGPTCSKAAATSRHIFIGKWYGYRYSLHVFLSFFPRGKHQYLDFVRRYFPQVTNNYFSKECSQIIKTCLGVLQAFYFF